MGRKEPFTEEGLAADELLSKENGNTESASRTENIPERDVKYTEAALRTGETLKRTIISDPEDDVVYVFSDGKHRSFRERLLYKRDFIFDIFYLASALLVMMIILAIVFQCGKSGMKDRELVDEEYGTQIAVSSRYNELLKGIDVINEEIDNLSHKKDEKQAEYDALMEYGSSSGDITEQIEAMRSELESLNAENEKKQREINELNSSIAEKASTIVNLPPGVYTVGKNIAAGRYTVTGSGGIKVSSKNGSLKVNKVLNADGTEMTLEDGDKIHLDDARAKFSPVQSKEVEDAAGI